MYVAVNKNLILWEGEVVFDKIANLIVDVVLCF